MTRHSEYIGIKRLEIRVLLLLIQETSFQAFQKQILLPLSLFPPIGNASCPFEPTITGGNSNHIAIYLYYVLLT
jgi:hypothetical protein